tara:strand:+ start:581 stop:1231 length:651 start_codon:yes stop_codon:yes gene_type:complete
MALNKLKFNSLNVTPTAGKTVGFNSNADGLEATLSGGAMTFIKKLTASSSSSLTFTHGSSDVVLDSTYKEYLFVYQDIHPSTDGPNFQIQFNAGGSAATKTTTSFYAYHNEGDTGTQLTYQASYDIAQGTGAQAIGTDVTDQNDSSAVGYVHLFNPSSTTFVKHFLAAGTHMHDNIAVLNDYVSGYCNTTTAVTEVVFSMQSGTIVSGTISLYGIN